MTSRFGNFVPDPAAAMALDRRMRRELGESLAYVCEQSAGIVAFDEAAMSALADGLKAGKRYRASAFADYYELAAALFEDDLDTAAARFDHIKNTEILPPGLPRFSPLGSAAIGEESERYRLMMERDSESDLGIIYASDAQIAHFHDRYQRGLALMEQAVPELRGEYEALVSELVPVAGDRTRTMQFDGGSHYRLWGALFLNTDFHQTPHAIVEVIAHEAGHSFLFSHCIEENLVTNTREERFSSPLRVEPRPMEGIYHATFVSARMHYAMARVLAANVLDGEARASAEEALKSDVVNFNSGYKVVAEHANLTETGRKLMDGALTYMRTAA